MVKRCDASLGSRYLFDAESAAKRSLKNRALQMLVSTDDPLIKKQLLTRYREATNMTDSIGALTALIDSEGKIYYKNSMILTKI